MYEVHGNEGWQCAAITAVLLAMPTAVWRWPLWAIQHEHQHRGRLILPSTYMKVTFC